MLFLLFSLALASGPPVVIDDPTLCDPYGYLPGSDFPDGNCCSFVVCDNARLNKTGFLGFCMGGTAWNQDLLVCDDPKYVPGCVPSADCQPMVTRTTLACVEGDISASTCCVGQRYDKDDMLIEFGNHPIFTQGPSGDQYYTIEGFPDEHKCPFGENFVVESCCCEPDYVQVAPCDEDTMNYYYTNPDDECCSYLQCWANKTGYDVVECWGLTVWNDVSKTCAMPNEVMECMTVDCGRVDMTDPPCPSPLGGDCCKAGLAYFSVAGDTKAYTIDDDTRLNCCPKDMNGDQLIFNFAEDFCCCELEEI